MGWNRPAVVAKSVSINRVSKDSKEEGSNLGICICDRKVYFASVNACTLDKNCTFFGASILSWACAYAMQISSFGVRMRTAHSLVGQWSNSAASMHPCMSNCMLMGVCSWTRLQAAMPHGDTQPWLICSHSNTDQSTNVHNIMEVAPLVYLNRQGWSQLS